MKEFGVQLCQSEKVLTNYVQPITEGITNYEPMIKEFDVIAPISKGLKNYVQPITEVITNYDPTMKEFGVQLFNKLCPANHRRD